MKKRFLAGIVIFSLILVVGAVIYLNAAPYFCRWNDQYNCEQVYDGTFYAYYDGTVTYMGNPVNAYDIHCWCPIGGGEPEMVWWGICYDIDGVYE